MSETSSPITPGRAEMKGLIAWFAQNDVAANLLLGFIVLCGVLTLLTRTTLEVFPEIERDIVTVRMSYRGATPAEVEEGVIIKIEEAIQDLVGIKEIRSTASEGSGSVNVEIDKGYDPRELMDDIKNRVDGVSTFPVETERPVFSVAKHRHEVISLVVSGRLSEHELRKLGERVRDELSTLPGITQVELTEVRPYEISVEVSESDLQKYGLSFDSVVSAVRKSSLDLPAGALKTKGGEILLRTKGQAYVREDFEKIVVVTRPDGTRLTLSEIADIKDDFEEEPLLASFNGEPCVILDVYRVGDQNAITLAQEVKEYIADAQGTMPDGVTLNFWRDRSKVIKARLQTLLRNGAQGGFLVILLLTMFLRFSVAMWVSVGIPVSFLGAIALMPTLGVTINVLSLFAFILVLGIVVDDAIVTGENIYTRLQTCDDGTEAAILGTQEVAVPVTFGVLTTVAAFVPLMMMEGRRAPFFAQISLIVIPVMLFSLIESKLVLPAHLKHQKNHRNAKRANPLARLQQKIADGLIWCIHTIYKPVLAAVLRWRLLTASVFIGAAILIGCIVYSGRVRFTPFPRIESEVASATLAMPLGTPFEITKSHVEKMEAAAQTLQRKHIDPKTGGSVIMNILATPGSVGSTRGQSHMGRVVFEIMAPEERTLEVSSIALVSEWRKLIGPLAGAEELSFRAEIGRHGDPIDVQLSGNDFDVLAEISDKVKARLKEYPAAFDITDSFQDGKEEIKLTIKPQAEVLGLTMDDLGRQVRQAFFGAEAQRIQRGRDDVRVMVRYPQSERRSIGNLETMRIRTPKGKEVPFTDVADAHMGRGFSSINRVDRRKTVNVTADLNKETANMMAINQELADHLTKLVREYPGVAFSLEGEAREERENISSLLSGGIFLLFAIYAMLAIPFKSYTQPLIVMSVIPFGLLGAVLGHMIMGMNLSMMSLFGMLALIGVVVNDSLVMVDYVNRRREEGLAVREAVQAAGVARFRAILLTSLTTFAGLMPLLLEKSTQAQFLIPMAVSLGFGVLFATFVTLLLVPISYLFLEDVVTLLEAGWRWLWD